MISKTIDSQHNIILKKYVWYRVDYDKAFNYQCVDWVREYSVLRWRSITNFGNAYQLWQKWLGPKWKRVPMTALGYPSEWDVVIWGPTWGGGYGHIAIVNKFCNPVVLRSVDQNAWSGNGDWLGKNSISNCFRGYSGVVGWFEYIG